jgi:hypothetical protein
MSTARQVIRLQNVRLSFPALFQERKFSPSDAKGSYSATFILDKKSNAKEIAEIKRAIDGLVKETFKGKHPGANRVCLRDGAEKEGTDGYGPDVMFISARTDKRPQVVARDLTPLTEDDGKPYAGCYVYATIEVWGQDNQYGKRVNAKLRAVQFFKDGSPFGEASIDVNKEFAPIPDDDESPV